MAEQNALERVRQRRRSIWASAQRLSELNQGNGRRLRKVSWEGFGSAPRWCMAPEPDRIRLQHICGALCHLPTIQRSLDGAYLRRWRMLLGDAVFDELLVFGAPDLELPQSEQAESGETSGDEDPASAAMASGSAVLLGTLKNDSLSAYFASLLGRPAALPEGSSAQHLLAAAIGVADRHSGVVLRKESAA